MEEIHLRVKLEKLARKLVESIRNPGEADRLDDVVNEVARVMAMYSTISLPDAKHQVNWIMIRTSHRSKLSESLHKGGDVDL